MRYVSESFQTSTLRRGKSLEQFLGPGLRDGEPTIRCIEIRPAKSGAFEVWVHEAEDLGDNEHLDYYEFIFDENPLGEPSRPLAQFETPLEALEFAEKELVASRERWTNCGVSQDEYSDFINAGRPSDWPII
jgi:hypothetical protein